MAYTRKMILSKTKKYQTNLDIRIMSRIVIHRYHYLFYTYLDRQISASKIRPQAAAPAARVFPRPRPVGKACSSRWLFHEDISGDFPWG